MKQLSKELLNETQTQRCLFNYFSTVWEEIKDNQPVGVWFDGNFDNKYQFLSHVIASLMFNAKVSADSDLDDDLITKDEYNDLLTKFGIVIKEGVTHFNV